MYSNTYIHPRVWEPKQYATPNNVNTNYQHLDKWRHVIVKVLKWNTTYQIDEGVMIVQHTCALTHSCTYRINCHNLSNLTSNSIPLFFFINLKAKNYLLLRIMRSLLKLSPYICPLLLAFTLSLKVKSRLWAIKLCNPFRKKQLQSHKEKKKNVIPLLILISTLELYICFWRKL